MPARGAEPPSPPSFRRWAATAGVLQELHILCGARVPLYLDSASSVFVAKSDTAVKKSVWLIRRASVLEDGVVHGEMEPIPWYTSCWCRSVLFSVCHGVEVYTVSSVAYMFWPIVQAKKTRGVCHLFLLLSAAGP